MSADFYGWCLTLGFILVMTVLIGMYSLISRNHRVNPLAPFIRAFERLQVHHLEMKRLKARANLARSGLDPEYVQFLENKNKEG